MTRDMSLYRWFDADGVLLYAGITNDLMRRQFQHSGSSTWTRFAASATMERFESRETALLAEATVIRSESPVFNVQHNDNAAGACRMIGYLIDHEGEDLISALDPGPRWSSVERIESDFASIEDDVRAAVPWMKASVAAFDGGQRGLMLYVTSRELSFSEWLVDLRAIRWGQKVWLHSSSAAFHPNINGAIAIGAFNISGLVEGIVSLLRVHAEPIRQACIQSEREYIDDTPNRNRRTEAMMAPIESEAKMADTCHLKLVEVPA